VHEHFRFIEELQADRFGAGGDVGNRRALYPADDLALVRLEAAQHLVILLFDRAGGIGIKAGGDVGSGRAVVVDDEIIDLRQARERLPFFLPDRPSHDAGVIYQFEGK
jgi:hypothetical protein